MNEDQIVSEDAVGTPLTAADEAKLLSRGSAPDTKTTEQTLRDELDAVKARLDKLAPKPHVRKPYVIRSEAELIAIITARASKHGGQLDGNCLAGFNQDEISIAHEYLSRQSYQAAIVEVHDPSRYLPSELAAHLDTTEAEILATLHRISNCEQLDKTKGLPNRPDTRLYIIDFATAQRIREDIRARRETGQHVPKADGEAKEETKALGLDDKQHTRRRWKSGPRRPNAHWKISVMRSTATVLRPICTRWRTVLYRQSKPRLRMIYRVAPRMRVGRSTQRQTCDRVRFRQRKQV